MNMTTCKTLRQFSFPYNALAVLRNSLHSRNRVAAVADQGTEISPPLLYIAPLTLEVLEQRLLAVEKIQK